MNKTQINRMVNYELQKERSIGSLSSYGWKFAGFSKSTRQLGVCCNSDKTIKISEKFIDILPDENIKNTILHEIAHAIDFETRGTSGHDATWRRIAKSIGCNATTTTDLSQIDSNVADKIYSRFKYLLVCEKHGTIGGFMRKTSSKYICNICKKSVKLIPNK